MIIAYIKFGNQVATVTAKSIERDPLVSKFVTLNGIAGIKETQYPLFVASTLRIPESRIEYILEGNHQDPTSEDDEKEGSIKVKKVETKNKK